MQQPKTTACFLFVNHDIHYMFNQPHPSKSADTQEQYFYQPIKFNIVLVFFHNETAFEDQRFFFFFLSKW